MFVFMFFLSCSDAPNGGSDEAPGVSTTEQSSTDIPIRVGWQETWATQGQLAVLMKEESILQNAGFKPEFVGFSYGAPLNEGALAGEVDVLFTADQPAIALCNRDNTWGIIGRLMYNRVGTFVPPASEIQTPADLKGKTIAIPFGAAAHRETLVSVREAGLDPIRDINTVNMGIQEISVLANTKQWSTVDAASAWDPVFAELESNALVRTIAAGRVTSVVVMDDDFEKKYPNSRKKFMLALAKAYERYRSDTQAANQRFIQASNLTFSSAALDLAASVEPNLKDGAPIRTALNDEDKANIQKAADFMQEANILKTKVKTSLFLR